MDETTSESNFAKYTQSNSINTSLKKGHKESFSTTKKLVKDIQGKRSKL